jgi:2-haloacid dehalogenase
MPALECLGERHPLACETRIWTPVSLGRSSSRVGEIGALKDGIQAPSSRGKTMIDAFTDVGFLGFDVFGTIVDWRSGVARESEPFLRRYGIIVDAYTFADEWRSLYQPALEEVRCGRRPWIKLTQLHRENLDRVLSRYVGDVRAIPDGELNDLNRAWEQLNPWPDVVEGLTRLKRRFAIGPISNGDIAGMMNLARFGSLPWDVIVGAEIAQSYKPQPQTYLRSAEAVGLSPKKIAMVAAHNSDLRAARAVELLTVFVRRPQEHGSDQTSDLRADEDWDLVVDSLIEAADALGCR